MKHEKLKKVIIGYHHLDRENRLILFKMYLKSHGALKKYYNNVLTNRPPLVNKESGIWGYISRQCTLPNIYSLFIWADTPEGFLYWREINDGYVSWLYDILTMPHTSIKPLVARILHKKKEDTTKEYNNFMVAVRALANQYLLVE